MNVARKWSDSRFVEAAIILCILATCYLLTTATLSPHEAGPHRTCKHNLKQLGLALHSYHDAYGQFPPPYVSDQEGRPMHSWRVLLLPYLDEPGLIKQYNLKEPWNSRHNSKLTEKMPEVFCCPDKKWEQSNGSRAWTPATTSYLALVGPGAAFKPGTSRRLADFKDRAASTIMIAEITDSDVNWLEPRDIDVSIKPLAITDAIHEKNSGWWNKTIGNHVLNVDGSVGWLSSNTESDGLWQTIEIIPLFLKSVGVAFTVIAPLSWSGLCLIGWGIWRTPSNLRFTNSLKRSLGLSAIGPLALLVCVVIRQTVPRNHWLEWAGPTITFSMWLHVILGLLLICTTPRYRFSSVLAVCGTFFVTLAFIGSALMSLSRSVL